jgi:phage baseplate assembly protein W
MNIIDQFKDNLRNLVQTNQGERLGRFNFGCNLKSLLFERSNLDNEFNEKATQNIIEQVKTYLPLFQIDDIAFKSENKFPHDTTSLAKITVNIKYSIPKLRLSNKQLEVILYCGG